MGSMKQDLFCNWMLIKSDWSNFVKTVYFLAPGSPSDPIRKPVYQPASLKHGSTSLLPSQKRKCDTILATNFYLIALHCALCVAHSRCPVLISVYDNWKCISNMLNSSIFPWGSKHYFYVADAGKTSLLTSHSSHCHSHCFLLPKNYTTWDNERTFWQKTFTNLQGQNTSNTVFIKLITMVIVTAVSFALAAINSALGIFFETLTLLA